MSFNFAKSVLSWFDQHGRKNLPWQKSITPYRVWISEIMLQQTQVATVIPYYERFLQRFSTLTKLAEAREDEVLALWTGLGYYSRARNLHKAAKIIQEKFAGHFPDKLETVQQLPGIGRSTAGAILSIAFKQATPILEGNVKRVLTRFHAIEGWPGDTKIQNQLWEIATHYMPQTRTADYTQAIMDLGAIVCTRSKPLCHQCPLQKNCQAHAQGQQSELPSSNPKKKSLPIRQTTMLILQNQEDALLLQKRPPTGIWASLWGFPEFKHEKEIISYCKNYNYLIKKMENWTPFRHTFSHFHLNITPIYAQIENRSLQIMDSEQQIWYKTEQLPIGGFSTPVKYLLDKLNVKSEEK